MRAKPLILGVLNVTPDSFSDGGKYPTLESAISRAVAMVRDGADIIDVGGESTRPGAVSVPLEEEKARTLPVLKELVARNIPVSIDTRKFELASAAVEGGAVIVNDVSGGSDPRLIGLLKDHPSVKLIVMHMQGSPEMMQDNPSYAKGVVFEVAGFLAERVRRFEQSSISRERLWIDPGIGFGKTYLQNLELLRNLEVFSSLSGRLVMGTSRKSFLAQVLGDKEAPFEHRVPGTIASNLWALSKGGASVFRVHDVVEMKRALLTWQTIEGETV